MVSSHTLTDETANGESTTSKSKRSTSLTSSEECSTESNKVNNEENLNRNFKDDGKDDVVVDYEEDDDDNLSLKSKTMDAENYSVDTPLSLRKAKELVAEVKRNDDTLKRIIKADVSLEAKHKMRNAHLSASNATLTNVRFSYLFFFL